MSVGQYRHTMVKLRSNINARLPHTKDAQLINLQHQTAGGSSSSRSSISSTMNSASSFDVRITPDAHSERCTSRKPCIEYGLAAVRQSHSLIICMHTYTQLYVQSTEITCTPLVQNTTEVMLPRDPMPVLEYPECIIELGCTYDVRVESNNRQHSINITYRIPGECRFHTDIYMSTDFRTGCLISRSISARVRRHIHFSSLLMLNFMFLVHQYWQIALTANAFARTANACPPCRCRTASNRPRCICCGMCPPTMCCRSVYPLISWPSGETFCAH